MSGTGDTENRDQLLTGIISDINLCPCSSAKDKRLVLLGLWLLVLMSSRLSSFGIADMDDRLPEMHKHSNVMHKYDASFGT